MLSSNQHKFWNWVYVVLWCRCPWFLNTKSDIFGGVLCWCVCWSVFVEKNTLINHTCLLLWRRMWLLESLRLFNTSTVVGQFVDGTPDNQPILRPSCAHPVWCASQGLFQTTYHVYVCVWLMLVVNVVFETGTLIDHCNCFGNMTVVVNTTAMW